MKQGSYVISIDDSNWDAEAFVRMSKLPVKGKIYRVRRIIPKFCKSFEGDGVAIEGIYGDWDFFKTADNKTVYEECHFRMSRFREIEYPIKTEELSDKEEALAELIA